MSEPDVYEFRVTGLIGPLTRAAMPELTSAECAKDSRLVGSVPDGQHITSLLDRLDQALIVINDIVITRTAHLERGTAHPAN